MDPMDIMEAGQLSAAGRPPLTAPTQPGGSPLEALRAQLQSRVRPPQQMQQLDQAQLDARNLYRQSAAAPMTSLSGFDLALATYLKNMAPGRPTIGLGEAIAAPYMQRKVYDEARHKVGLGLGGKEVGWADTDREEARKESDAALRELGDLERIKGVRDAQGGQISIRALELLKKNKEHIRQMLKQDTSVSPQAMEQTVNQKAMQQTVSDLRGIYTDDQIKQLLPGMWQSINNTPAMQPTQLGALESTINVDRPATGEAPGVQLSGMAPEGLAGALRNAPGSDVMAILAALPPAQRATVENLMRGAAKMQAQGNTSGAQARVAQAQAVLSSRSTADLAASAAGAKKAAELQAEQGIKPKTVGMETAEKEGEQVYSKAFDEQVLRPAMATEETSRVMTQFEQLAKMNEAMRSGAIKEWAAGDGGKWIASILPEDSELRKGIANAQTGQQLQQAMVNAILMAAKGVQTEGDAQRAVQQLTSVGKQKEANEFMAAFMKETAARHNLRKGMAEAHKRREGSWQGFDNDWQSSPYMTTTGSVKRLPTSAGQPGSFVGMTEYLKRFKAKNPGATDADAANSWNRMPS